MNTNHDDLRRLVDGHFTKGLSPANEARLRAHLPACAGCRDGYEAYQAAERLDPKAQEPRQRLATALGLPSESKWSRRRSVRWTLATVSVVGAMALLLVVTTRTQSGDGMVSRGRGIENAESLEVAVFRVKGERESMFSKAWSKPGRPAFGAFRRQLSA